MTVPVTTLPPFATAEQYEAMTGQTPPDSIDDVLNGISTAIRRYAGWHIAPVLAMDLVLDGSGGLDQPLPSLHVESVDSIAENGVVGDTANLEWSESGILRKVSRSPWTKRFRGIALTISHGFDMAEVADLTLLTLTLSGRFLASPSGETAANVGAVSITYGGLSSAGGGSLGVTPIQRSVLDSYLLPWRN